jgi:PAS domain-containing protein
MQIISSFFLVLIAGITIPISLYSWQRRNETGAIPLLIMAVAVGIWTLFTAIEIIINNPFLQQICVAFQFIGISAIPPAWLAFTLCFTGRVNYIQPYHTIIATAVGLILVILIATNGWHQLVWHEVINNNQIKSEPWIVYWIFIVYAYLLLIVGFVLIFERLCNSASVFRWQTWIIALAGLLPAITYPLYLIALFPESIGDPTPFSLFFSVIFVLIGVPIFQILDLSYISHTSLINLMNDALLVIDDRERIIKYNIAATRLFPSLQDHSIGKQISKVIQEWSCFCSVTTSKKTKNQFDMFLHDKRIVLEISTTNLSGTNSNGLIMILRDVTQLQNALDKIQELSGLIPICSHCKKIRDDQGFWDQVDTYISKHTEVQFTHGICPECAEKHYKDHLEQ